MLWPTSTIWSRAGALALRGRAPFACCARSSRICAGAVPERLARGIQVEPELVVLADLRVAPQVVEHFHPRDRARPQAVDHHDGDLVGVERLEHVQAGGLLGLFGVEQAERWRAVFVERRLAEEVGQRRAEVGFQRGARAVGVDVRRFERVVQLEHGAETRGCRLRPRRAASARRRRGERGGGGLDDFAAGCGCGASAAPAAETP